jgi:hypothetical protein
MFVVVASLAVGIGANAVVFTWIRTTLLNAIPAAAHPEELAVLVPEHKTGGLTDTMSLLDIDAVNAGIQVCEGIQTAIVGRHRPGHVGELDPQEEKHAEERNKH